MRIGFFYRDYLNRGGIPLETASLVAALERRGHGVIVHCYEGVRRASELGSNVRSYEKPISFLRVPRALKETLTRNADGLEALFIVGGHIAENYAVSMKSKRGGIPYIVSPASAYNAYNLAERRFRKAVWKRLYESQILKNALAVRCYSRKNVEEMDAYLPGLNTFVLREGLHEADTARRDETLFDRRWTNLLFLGRLSIWKKGIDQLLKAMGLLSERHEYMKLHLVGPVENGDRAEFQRLCDGLPSEVLQYHGPVYGAEKFSYLASADAFVHPSRHEGIPRSIREAMSAGTPLIVTPETNVAEDVERYEAGFVVSCEAASIASGIEAFLEHPNKEQVGRNACRMASELYNWDVVAADLEEHLRYWRTQGLLK